MGTPEVLLALTLPGARGTLVFYGGAVPMSMMDSGKTLQDLCARIQECIGPVAGRVEYGNLRCRISEWDGGAGDTVTNIALVYETPGGSTDQINISYHHLTSLFSLVDVHEGEVTTASIESVLESVR